MSDQDLRYTVTAEDRFSRTFQQLKRDVGDTRERFGGLIDRVSGLNLAIGSIAFGAAAGGAGIAAGIKQLAHDIDALNDAADATGSTVENLSALERVARLNGESLEVVSAATLKLNKVLAEAQPNTPMAQALQRIGLDAEALRKVDPAEAVQQVAQALAGYADDGDKARLVQELFGKSAKELAPFLKDLAEAGKLNATVTSDQAREAERFNKELAAMSTHASEAARGIANRLLPAINQLFRDMRDGGLSKALGLDGLENRFDAMVAGYKLLGVLRERITPMSILEKDPTNEKALKQLAEIDDRAKALGKTLADTQQKWLGLTSNAGAGRGFVNPEVVKPGVGPMAAPTAKVEITEYDRYLERLTKEAEGYQNLTTQQQLALDLQSGRLKATAGQRQQLERLAEEADFAKAMNGYLKDRADAERKVNEALAEREQHMQRLMDDIDTKDVGQALRLLEQTPSARLQALEQQSERLLDFSRRIGQDDPRQKQVLEAMEALKKQAQEIATPAEKAQTEYERLADAIDKSMDRATDAVLDFVVEGKGSVEDLGRAFSRDILRQLINEPIRETMRDAARDIAALVKGESGAGPIAQLLGALKGGGGLGGFFGAIGSMLGFTGRAGGGSVGAGDLVRWQENGREWFVPSTDGTVLNESQMRRVASGGGVQQSNTFIIQGGDPAEVQRQINAALSRNNDALVRSLRAGRLAAA